MTSNTFFLRCSHAALALTFALVAAMPASAAEAGKLLFVAGSVTLERTPPVALKQGDTIQSGDVIVTGEKSRAQIVMNDGARVALRAASRYRVDEFSLPGAVGAPTQATTARAEGVTVATLLKGGFRSSTGAIGKDGAGTYEVRTPIGTLGIRGTDYTAVWCEGDCADVPGAPAAQDGMYLATHTGAIVFRYGTREQVVNGGQAFFIAAADALPQPLDRLPQWLLEDGAGPLVTGEVRDIGQGPSPLPDLSDRREPPAGQQPPGTAAPDPKTEGEDPGVARPITGTQFGEPVDLTSGQFDQRSPNDPPPGTPSLPPPSNNVPPPTNLPPPTNVPPPGGN